MIGFTFVKLVVGTVDQASGDVLIEVYEHGQENGRHNRRQTDPHGRI